MVKVSPPKRILHWRTGHPGGLLSDFDNVCEENDKENGLVRSDATCV
jgi:hypothetical protein